MHSHAGGRKAAVSEFLNLWVVSGSMLSMAYFTIGGDEIRMKKGLKDFALAASSGGSGSGSGSGSGGGSGGGGGAAGDTSATQSVKIIGKRASIDTML